MKRATVFYWLICMALATVAIGAAFYFDNSVWHFIQQHRTGGMYVFMRNVSRFGDWPSHVVPGLILLAIAWVRGNKKWTRIFLSMLIALALAGVIGRGIKIATARPRPSVKVEHVLHRSRFNSKYHSFPSGHVAASTAFFGVLVLASLRIGLACFGIPILIAVSRLYVGAHYLSDVVCAAVLGILCALLVSTFLLRGITNQHSQIGN